MADVAEPVAAGDLGRQVRAGPLGHEGGNLPDRDGLARADVVGGNVPDALSLTAWIASTLARATSETWTKSRSCRPSSNTCGGSPLSIEERNIAATPEYGVSRGMPGP